MRNAALATGMTSVIFTGSSFGEAEHAERSDLMFQVTPETNLSVGSCLENPDTYVTHIENDPGKADALLSDAFTVGFTELRTIDGYPIFVAGVTVRALGGLSFELATSEHEPGKTTIVNLGSMAYAEVLPGGEGYDAVLSARLGEDDRAYFRLDCMSEFGFNGDRESIPLESLPTIPPEEYVPEPQQPDLRTV